jgi:hypothetical protein
MRFNPPLEKVPVTIGVSTIQLVRIKTKRQPYISAGVLLGNVLIVMTGILNLLNRSCIVPAFIQKENPRKSELRFSLRGFSQF